MTLGRDVVLRAAALTVSRADVDGPVLAGIDLSLTATTLTDITGPSGCGKSTLLLALARLMPGVEGTLELHGRTAREWAPADWRGLVSYVPQTPAMLPGPVADNLTLPWTLKSRATLQPPSSDELRLALDGMRLGDVALDRDAARLSVGQTARIALLRAVLTRPDVLLLDEPDAALDDDSAETVAAATRAFADAGGAVVRVRHARSDERADRRFRLTSGVLEEVGA